MKKIALLAMVIIFWVSIVEAAPFLVCDPQAGITNYKLTGPAWVPANVTAQADGSLKMDANTAIVGSNSLTISACVNDPVWGEVCSSAVPFSFTRPTGPITPTNIKLIP